MKKSILITGATGLIGKNLVNAFLKRGDGVIALTTNYGNAEKVLPGQVKIVETGNAMQLAEENIDVIINLAGANLGGKRWNAKTKKVFYDSRINTTKQIVRLIEKMKRKPKALLSASGVDYYGDCGDRDIYEDSPPADDFLGRLTGDWEREAEMAGKFGVRALTLRTGFVIARESDAVKKMTLPFRLFTGGPLGSGKQYISWIHIEDLTEIYLFSADNKNVKGAVNAASPEPVTNRDNAKIIGKILRRPAFFRVPAFFIRLAVGEMADVVLNGRRALPGKLNGLGFRFRFEKVIDAWRDVL